MDHTKAKFYRLYLYVNRTSEAKNATKHTAEQTGYMKLGNTSFAKSQNKSKI